MSVQRKLSDTCQIAKTHKRWLTSGFEFGVLWLVKEHSQPILAIRNLYAFHINTVTAFSSCLAEENTAKTHTVCWSVWQKEENQSGYLLACRLILLPLGGGSCVWLSSARGNMLTASLSNSQPVPPPAADALLIIVQRQRAKVEEFSGKQELGRVFCCALLAQDKRGTWDSVLPDKPLTPELGFTFVLVLSSSLLTCVFPQSRPGLLTLSSHCNKMQMTELIPPRSTFPSRLYCPRLWASKWLNIWREVSAFFMGWGLLLF